MFKIGVLVNPGDKLKKGLGEFRRPSPRIGSDEDWWNDPRSALAPTPTPRPTPTPIGLDLLLLSNESGFDQSSPGDRKKELDEESDS